MKSSKSQRWDIAVGGAASVIAIAGLAWSIAVENTASVGFGVVHRETQNILVVIAGIFLILVAIKAGLRYGKRCYGDCDWAVERLFKRSRRRP